MSDPLDLVHLRTVVAIADCGGFHRAAAALHLSQSTVSQHVRQLERVLDQPLVEKAGRGTRFTVAGEALLGEARRILAVHDQALARLSVSAGPAILLGCTEHVAGRLLGPVVAALSASFPGCTARVRVDRSNRLEEAVDRGVLDVAVVLAGEQTSGAGAGSLPLAWYAAPSFVPPAAVGAGRGVGGVGGDGAVGGVGGVGGESGPADAPWPGVGGEPGSADAPWPVVAFEEPCGLRRRAVAALEGLGRTVAITAESTSLEGVLAAARAGLGVALLPSVTGSAPSGLVPVPALPDLGAIDLCVTARRGLEPSIAEVVTNTTTSQLMTRPHAA